MIFKLTFSSITDDAEEFTDGCNTCTCDDGELLCTKNLCADDGYLSGILLSGMRFLHLSFIDLLKRVKGFFKSQHKIYGKVTFLTNGLTVTFLFCNPIINGSIPPFGTLGNVSENLPLGLTQALLALLGNG